jgi:hypothetical protein
MIFEFVRAPHRRLNVGRLAGVSEFHMLIWGADAVDLLQSIVPVIGYSPRRACGLVGLHPKTYRYASKSSGDEELRKRLRELASQRRQFG